MARVFTLVPLVLALGSSLPDYAAPGQLDRSFGEDGRFSFYAGASSDGAWGMALQSDGKIVVAGTTFNDPELGESLAAVARVNPDGTMDSSFGTDGIIKIDFTGTSEGAYAVAIQADDRIVVAGSASRDCCGAEQFSLARLTSDGTLDPTFSGDGKLRFAFPFSADDFARDVVIQPDGKIVAAGTSADQLAVARFDSSGSVDTSFGNGGWSTAAAGGAHEVELQADGKIVLAGAIGNGFGVVRFDAAGMLDPSFGGDGIVDTQFEGFCPNGAEGLAIQSDGMIVTAGTVSGSTNSNEFTVVRYLTDGTLDHSFGREGITYTNFVPPAEPGTAGSQDELHDLVVQADGRIVVAGMVDWAFDSRQANFALARYLSTGRLDRGFGRRGKVITDFDQWSDTGWRALLQPDGKIVVGGQVSVGNWFGVARYLAS